MAPCGLAIRNRANVNEGAHLTVRQSDSPGGQGMALLGKRLFDLVTELGLDVDFYRTIIAGSRVDVGGAPEKPAEVAVRRRERE